MPFRLALPQILAVGLLDGPELLRLTIAPDAQRDEDLAQLLVEDVTEPESATTGGTSRGVTDYLRPALRDMGASMLVDGVAVRQVTRC